MPKFVFEAKGPGGKNFRGEIEAANEPEARIKLRGQRLVPVRLSQAPETGKKKTAGGGGGGGAKSGGFGGKVNSKDLQIFTRQLSTLLSSGVPIMQSMETLADGSRSPALTFALKDIGDQVSKGKRFGEALAGHPKIFDRFYVNMVVAGEESGNLDAILNRLAIYIEKSVKIQGKIKGAMAYPAAIITIALLVVVGLLVFVIPKFKELFESSGAELPALTQLVVDMSEFIMSKWWMLIAGVGGTIYGFTAYKNTPAGKQALDAILIDVPFIGDLIRKGAVAKFTRTMSTLLGSGVGIMECLDIASKVVGNHVIEKAILRAKDAISEGKSLTVPLSKEKYIPHMVTQMIGVGEQTGALDVMLGKVADFYEDEVDVAVGALTSVMEPMMMVVLGGIVAFFVVAIYLPIFNLAGAAGG
ncbi:MAG: type II secretion system F family protein [Bdellovibrionota bacterium]